MGISIPPININPGIGGATIPENTAGRDFSQSFLQAFLGTKDAELRKQLFELQKKKMDMELTDKKTEAERQKTEGAAVLELLPSLIGMGVGPSLLQGAQGQQMGPSAQDTDIGPPVPPAGSQTPSQAFSGVVGNLPVESVPGFVQKFAPMMQAAQQRQDQKLALDEADRLAGKLMTPDERSQMQLARALAESGAPDELWQAQLPKAKIELAKAVEELKTVRNKRDADRMATAKLMQLGLLPLQQGGPGEEYVVEGATKILTDHLGEVRKEAIAANRERAKELRAEALKSLQGAALEVAALNPDWTASKVKAALKTNPTFANLPDGVISKVAFEAPETARRLNAPRNESEARVRVTYGSGRAALLVVNAMDLKGEGLGAAARFAQTEGKEAAMAAGATGFGIGSALGTPMVGGPIGGALGGAAGLVAAPVLRAAGRASMSDDQQRLWTAAQSLAAAIYRPETGAAAKDEEVRQTIERYIPLSTDKPPTRELKRRLRAELDATLANVSGLPSELRKEVVDGLLSKQEQELLKAGVPMSAPTASVNRLSPMSGLSFQRP